MTRQLLTTSTAAHGMPAGRHQVPAKHTAPSGAPTSGRPSPARTVEASAVARLSPCLETLEDFRATLTSADPPAQPNLPPALQSMEAFKTRRSFLNGQVGLDTPYGADSTEDSEDGTGDEIAWLQATELTELCGTDMSDASAALRQFCERVHSERAALQQEQEQSQPQPQQAPHQQAAVTSTSGDDTDEEDDIF